MMHTHSIIAHSYRSDLFPSTNCAPLERIVPNLYPPLTRYVSTRYLSHSGACLLAYLEYTQQHTGTEDSWCLEVPILGGLSTKQNVC